MEIKKWYVYLADLNPRFGTEPKKAGPVVVVQTNLLNNRHPSTIICPLTTNVHPQSNILRVHLQKGEVGLMEKSDIMVDQIRSIDNRRFLKQLGIIGRTGQKGLAKNIQIILS